MEALYEKIDALTTAVSGLQNVVSLQASRLEKLEDSSRESGHESAQSKSKGKSKSDRVAVEKERQYKLLQEKIKGKFNYSDSSSGDNDSSNEAAGLKDVRKKMSRKQKKLCESRVQSTLKKVGGIFPDDVESSSSAGKDSSDTSCGRRRNKVKSGAKIKIRPVIKTELWPHTVANENDGEQVTCDNIS